MGETDKVFAGSIPEIYDTYLVPLIFEAFAVDLAERVASAEPRAVLETAAGTGVVTRALAPMLGSEAHYVVTDLNQAMLDCAALRQPPDPRIAWQQGDALALPFADGVFDVVCCQFGAMFFPDKIKGYREAWRLLAPGGRFVFNVWDRIEENEFADVVTQAAAGVFADDPPRFLARTPHGYHDTDRIVEELRAAGFSSVDVLTKQKTSHAPSARHPAIAYCQGTPLRNEIEARGAGRLDLVTEMAASAIAERYGSGPVAGKIQGFVILAQK